MKKQTIAVIGAGAWGSALALSLLANGHEVRLWFFDRQALKQALSSRRNPFLPDFVLPPELQLTGSLAKAVQGADLVLLVSPAQTVSVLLRRLRRLWPDKAVLVNCAKGIDTASGALICELAAKYLPQAPYAVLSGPSFAEELARGKETAVVIASREPGLARRLQQIVGNHFFRPYAARDVIGVEVAGAYKNILAITVGLLAGLEKGENIQAALVARGLKEMSRFGMALGAKRQTFFGLAGVGDLVLTARSCQSRNYRFGLALASGQSQSLLRPGQPVVEGYYTVKSVLKRAKRLGLELTIASELNRVMTGRRRPAESVHCLMCRRWKQEA